MYHYSLPLFGLISVLSCTAVPAKNATELSQLDAQLPATTTSTNNKIPAARLSRHRHESIQINGKKFLRDREGEKWRLYDVEFSQYVIASNSLVLQTDNLPAALASASLTADSVRWRKIALNTYQAEFEMSQIESIYRSLVKAQQKVEWILDYSNHKQGDTM